MSCGTDCYVAPNRLFGYCDGNLIYFPPDSKKSYSRSSPSNLRSLLDISDEFWHSQLVLFGIQDPESFKDTQDSSEMKRKLSSALNSGAYLESIRKVWSIEEDCMREFQKQKQEQPSASDDLEELLDVPLASSTEDLGATVATSVDIASPIASGCPSAIGSPSQEPITTKGALKRPAYRNDKPQSQPGQRKKGGRPPKSQKLQPLGDIPTPPSPIPLSSKDTKRKRGAKKTIALPPITTRKTRSRRAI